MYQHPILLHKIHCPLKYFPLFFSPFERGDGWFLPPRCLPGGDYLRGWAVRMMRDDVVRVACVFDSVRRSAARGVCARVRLGGVSLFPQNDEK